MSDLTVKLSQPGTIYAKSLYYGDALDSLIDARTAVIDKTLVLSSTQRTFFYNNISIGSHAVTLTGAQTVAGIKTFTSALSAGSTIELGHASDTTISRVSAGIIAVEGVPVVTTSSTDTLTNKTLTSPTFTTPVLGTPTSGTLTNCIGLPVGTGVSGLGTSVATALAINLNTTGSIVTTNSTVTLTNKTLTSPTLTTPILGTPTSGTLTSCTGLPVSTGISGMGTGVLGLLQYASTGTGGVVGSNTPTLITPLLGTPTSGTLTNCTGLPVTTGVSGLGTGVATLLTGTPSGTGGPVGTTSPTLGGTLTVAQASNAIAAKFTAPNTASDLINLQSTSATGYSSLGFYDENNAAKGSFGYSNNSAGAIGDKVFFSAVSVPMVFSTNQGTTSHVSIATSGGVSIGTTTDAGATNLLVAGTISGTLTNCTGLPVTTGVSGLGTNVAAFLATPTSANLAAALTDETGTGAAVFATSPTITTPVINQINPTTILQINGTGTAGLFGLKSTSATGYSSLELINSTNTQTGGFGYANASAAAYADQVYFYASGKPLMIATAAGSRHFFMDTTGAVSIGSGSTPSTKAILDLTSTTKGFLPPRMTTTERNAITSPPAGLTIYNTTTNKLNVYTTAWEAGTSGLGTDVAAFLATPTSANLRSALTDETGTGAAVFGTNPTLTGYTEANVAIGDSGISKTLSLANGTFQTVTLTGNCTFTMPAVVTGQSFILKVNTGNGANSAVFTGVKWPGNTAPTITTAAGKYDLLSFIADATDGEWAGSIIQNYTSPPV